MKKTVTMLDIPFDAMSEGELMQTLLRFLDEERNHIIVTPNPEGVMQARRNPGFKRALLDADLRLPDGAGIVIASRMQRGARSQGGIPCRLRGYDTVMALFAKAAERKQGLSVYLLGAAPGVAEAAKATAEEKYPALRVAGYHHGYFNAEEERLILEDIRQTQPDILLVGTGMPKQELWAHKHRDEISARLTLCVGGTIDILGGKVQLAPAFLRRLGLEWLYRLVTDPSRATRMLDLPRFMLAALTERKKIGETL